MEKGAGGRSGQGNQQLTFWKCGHCLCGKNLGSYWFCKHCKAPRPEPSDPELDRLGAWANGPPALQPGPQPIPTGEALSEEELERMVSLANRFGDVAAASQYKVALERLRAANKVPEEKPLQQRATAAHQRAQFLEKKLNGEIDKLEKWRAWCQEKAVAQQLSSELEEADAQHKVLVDQLHSSVCDTKVVTPQPAGLKLRDIVDGKLDGLEFVDAGEIFSVPEDEYVVTEGDKQILRDRTNEFKAHIARVTKEAFGGIISQLDTIKQQHAQHMERAGCSGTRMSAQGGGNQMGQLLGLSISIFYLI
ncbi:unnamed protein product [Prorocentrum cordatum]|uniref:RanBP2-type domain-containing protein n=1 Tax=Prorocentrum cordatum TaxID=2364126 RepID=A0ABN9PBC8_9DINO|nr:unnamed protein product [Polarella glacialis]